MNSPSRRDKAPCPISESTRQYEKAATALNDFFSRHLSRYCAECLAFHRKSAPADAIARHRLARGQFPGCCQEGVAESAHIPGAEGVRLSDRLLAGVVSRRPPKPTDIDTSYVVEDERDGRLHEGKGCAWLGAGGCVLGAWKSPICLAYLCPPLIEELSARAGRPLEDDFTIVAGTLAQISLGAENGGESLMEAEKGVAALLAKLLELDRELSKG